MRQNAGEATVSLNATLTGNYLLWLPAVIIYIGAGQAAQADQLGDIQARLDMITSTAQSICGSVEAHGQSSETRGEVSVALGGLLSRLATIGASAHVDTREYSGFLQEDAARAIENNENCKQHIFDSLNSILLLPAPTPVPTPAPTPSPTPLPSPNTWTIRICPTTASSNHAYFAVSLTGDSNNISGWYAAEPGNCPTFSVVAPWTAVYVAQLQQVSDPITPAGSYDESEREYPDSMSTGEKVSLPVCAQHFSYPHGSWTDDAWRNLTAFTSTNGVWTKPCNDRMDKLDFSKIFVNSEGGFFKVSASSP